MHFVIRFGLIVHKRMFNAILQTHLHVPSCMFNKELTEMTTLSLVIPCVGSD